MEDSLLKLPEVVKRTGLRKSTIYARMKTGTFPASVSLGPRSVAWAATAIQKWIEVTIAATQQSNEA